MASRQTAPAEKTAGATTKTATPALPQRSFAGSNQARLKDRGDSETALLADMREETAPPPAPVPTPAPPPEPEPAPPPERLEEEEEPLPQNRTDHALLAAAPPPDPGNGASPPPADPRDPSQWASFSKRLARELRADAAALPSRARALLEDSFGRDLSPIRIHDDSRAAALAAQVDARAFTLGRDIFLGADAPRNGAAAQRLLAHEVAHSLQQGLGPADPDLILGGHGDRAEEEADHLAALALLGLPARPALREQAATIRRDRPPSTASARVAPATQAQIDAFLTDPPSTRMTASLEGLTFVPISGEQFVLPDQNLGPTAVVLAHLCGTNYNPSLPRQLQALASDHRIHWEFANTDQREAPWLRLRPTGLAVTLDFLSPSFGDTLALTAEQRALVLAGEALNPIPPPILAELRHQAAETIEVTVTADGSGGGNGPTTVGTTPTSDQLLVGNRAAVNQLATLWWSHTQDYVRAWSAWRATPTPDTLTLAAVELDSLFTQFLPYSELLTTIYADTALRPLPAWSLLWPTRGGAIPTVNGFSPAAAADFTRFAASQPPAFRRLAQRDAAARRSLLEGFAANRGNIPTLTGDQSTTDAPSPYNAPALPMHMQAYPPLSPPSFSLTLDATTTFFSSIQFDSFVEGMSHALGGWEYRWDHFKVPNDDPATLNIMSVPPQQASEWDALQANLSRDLRYAAEDMERLNTVNGMAMTLGEPGSGPETIVSLNLLMSLAGSIAHSTIAVVAGRQSEYGITPTEPGLYIVRCVAGPQLSDETTVAQFRRTPSVAWMPFWARTADDIARTSIREQGIMRGEDETRYRELRDMLSTATHANDAELRAEMERLRVSLYGTGLEVLEAQRAAILERQTQLQMQGDTRSAEYRELETRLTDIGLMIGMRRDRARSLGGAPLRLPATLVRDVGGPMSLLIEASKPDPAQPLWYISDLTTPLSRPGDPRRGDGTLAPDYPNEDAILATLKHVLENGGGYGRGRLAVQFPPNLDRTDQTTGNLRSIRIAAGPTEIALQGLQSVATLASIAAVVAAPFTGGASLTLLMPIGMIGAIPSAFRLVERGQAGTLRFDLDAAMAVVDIASAIFTGGELGAGMRAASLAGTRAGLRWAVVEGSLWIVGVGGNGLGMMLMGAGLVKQITDLNNMPDGVRATRIMEILGRAMLDIGIQAGAHLLARPRLHAAETGIRSLEPSTSAATRVAHETGPAPRAAGREAPTSELTRAMPGDLAARIAIDIEPALAGNTVRVEYAIGNNGRVDPRSIRMAAGRGAGAADIAAHVETARTLEAYAGMLGRVLEGIEGFRNAITGQRLHPQQGSAAFEARLELGKLQPMIQNRLGALRRLPSDHPQRLELEADILNLNAQIDAAHMILAGLMGSDAQGFIAARSVAQRGRENVTFATGLNMMVVQRLPDGSYHAVPAATATAGGIDPAPNHSLHTVSGRPTALYVGPEGRRGTAQLRIMEEGGRWYLVPSDYAGQPIRHPDGAADVSITGLRRDFPSVVARAAVSSPHDATSFPVLEAALTAAGLPVDSQTRALLRRWGNTLVALGSIAQESRGRGLNTSQEIARIAATALMAGSTGGTVIEARYRDFRRAIRQEAVSAILGIPREDLARGTGPGGTPLQARPAAEQMAMYRRLADAVPESGDVGELWTRYREARSALPGTAGGFGFRPTAIATRLLDHGEHTEVDGAIEVTTPIINGPPAGRHALESKGGSSYDTHQARRYSDHLAAHDGTVVLEGGVDRYAGIVYLFDNLTTARGAVRDLDRNSRHGNIRVMYVDEHGQVVALQRSIPPVSPTASAPTSPASLPPSGGGSPPP